MQKDPFNVIVAGVGGQGNVVSSLLLGSALVDDGYKVTIGETYGASQRGGSVMSHLRVSRSRQYGPLIPPGFADAVIALEPSEAARVLGKYGNPETVGIINTRPVYPVDVIGGLLQYPKREALYAKIDSLCRRAYFVDATEHALELGNPVLANIMMLGAVAAAGIIPLHEEGLARAISDHIGQDKVEINLKAFRTGRSLIREPSYRRPA
jgi:indolepyruvate ferredoxin oxidoreductase beta subunit